MKKYILFLTVIFISASQAYSANVEDQKLNVILDQYKDAYFKLNPQSEVYYGGTRYLDQFGEYLSAAYMKKERTFHSDYLNRLKTINPQKLSPARLQSYKLFKQDNETNLQVDQFPWEYLGFNQMNETLRDFIDNANVDSYSEFPFDSYQHFQDYIKRGQGITHFVDEYIVLHREGLKKGIIQNCKIGELALNGIAIGATLPAEKSPFWLPLKKLPANLTPAQKSKITAQFKTLITDTIAPQYQRFIDFYKTEYQPHCSKNYGLAGLPQSQEWYDSLIYQGTTTKMTADEIHEMGLKEVERISKAMDEIKIKLGHKGTLKEFLVAMQNDPKSYYPSRDEMLKNFNATLNRIREKLPSYFLNIPERSLKIVEDTNYNQPAARYDLPTDTRYEGWFLLNTANLKSSQKNDTTSLCLHEGIPGHHFQFSVAFAREKELTYFERHLYTGNSYVEGWALYSEYLGNEMGLYTDPLQKFGNLDEDMLRAVRLVVDTGIHHFGWSREKVIQYMSDHLASDISEVTTEADRYAAWPGQALGYKVGQLKILGLRAEAEKSLGPKFNIKEFHDVVLKNGVVSLDVLAENVRVWVDAKK